MAADALTLESLGVNLDELARRIGQAQERAALSDEACATLAGVTVDRWRAWKESRERPGVARMPKLSAAVKAPVSWLMFGSDPLDTVPKSESDVAMDFARRAASLLQEAVPLIESIARIAAEIGRDRVPIAGGVGLATSLKSSAMMFDVAGTTFWERAS